MKYCIDIKIKSTKHNNKKGSKKFFALKHMIEIINSIRVSIKSFCQISKLKRGITSEIRVKQTTPIYFILLLSFIILPTEKITK